MKNGENCKLLKINERFPIDIIRHQAHNALHHMEMQQTAPPEKRAVKKSAYPLRFRSKAQKKRLEEAAKRVHKTLRDFLLDLGDKAAAETGELKAS